MMHRALRSALALLCASVATGACAAGDTRSASPAAASTPVAAVPAASGRPWVSAYYAGWYWEWCPPAAVDMTALTHLIFGRYAPGAGTLGGAAGQVIDGAGTGHQPEVEDALIARAHASGRRALMMLGGAGDGEGFVASTAPAARATFVHALLTKLVAKDYDGVDVDWEDGLETAGRRAQLASFLRELRAAAEARPRYRPPNAPFIITFPGYAVNVNTDLPIEPWKVEVASLVDQYNLMTYAQNFDGLGWQTWFFSALRGAGPAHPTSVESSIQAYVNAGVPRTRLGMGIGLFGSYYYAPVSGPRQPHTGGGGGNDNYENYANFHQQGLLGHANGSFVWDDAAAAGYFRYTPPAEYRRAPGAAAERISMLTLEEPRGIAAKGTWARAGNCGGTIVWTINYGYLGQAAGNPAMDAIKQAFLSP